MVIKIATAVPEARTTMIGVTWLSDTLLMPGSIFFSLFLSILINPIRSRECTLKYKNVFVRNLRVLEQEVMLNHKCYRGTNQSHLGLSVGLVQI
jgi:hypothetical protein